MKFFRNIAATLAAILAAGAPIQLPAADPMATHYSVDDCLGSALPYPAPDEPATYPDSLTPVFINHVGRHGARYLSSPKTSVDLMRVLQSADSAGVLTPLGRSLMETVSGVIEISHNRWGALDSLGMAEQRGIASRMFRAYPRLFADGTVSAISSYSPRCVMSMYEFTHQLTTSSGRRNSPLMRPFDVVTEYVDWYKSREWKAPYDMYFETTAPTAPARRLITDPNYLSNSMAREVVWNEYKVLSGMPAMGLSIDLSKYFTTEELNALWSCQNLQHYLVRTATTLSSEPALIASELLLNLINTTDAAIEGKNANINLRFGHAETLMPLLSLMRLPGCFYLTNRFETVARGWTDFTVVPMAANLQLILFRSETGRYYLRVDLNEKPVALRSGYGDLYTPWNVARVYLSERLPLY